MTSVMVLTRESAQASTERDVELTSTQRKHLGRTQGIRKKLGPPPYAVDMHNFLKKT